MTNGNTGNNDEVQNGYNRNKRKEIIKENPKLRSGTVRLSNFLSALTSALGAVRFRHYPDDSDPIKT